MRGLVTPTAQRTLQRYDASMHQLWTIGYQGRAQHDVIGLLVEAGVELLVDVRLRPMSRKPGFSKKALAAALPLDGIAYEHRVALGTPLDIRGLFRAGELEEARRQYREYLVGAAAADLEWLEGEARKRPTAVLCFEFDPNECHRRVIAQELNSRHGYEISDL